MGELKLVKKVVFGAVALYLIRELLRFRKTLLEWQNSKNLARKLPTLPVPEKRKNSLNFFSWLKDNLPEGEEFTPDNLAKYFISSVQKAYQKHGNDEGLICLWLANPKLTPLALCNIVIWDMDIVRELTSARVLPNIVKSKSYSVTADLIGKKGLLRSSHEVWHPQRLVIEKGFTTDYVNKQAPMIRRTAQELIQKFTLLHQTKSKEDGFLQMDIVEEMMKATMDVIGRFAFSYDIGCINNPEAGLYKDFEVALDILQERMRNPLLFATRNILPTKQNREFRRRINNIDTLIKKMIKERTSNESKSETNDMLDVLLEAYVGDGVEDKTTGRKIKFTEDQIITNIRVIFFGGHDTTAAALNWTFYLLAKHPEVSQKILEELERNDHDFSAEGLEKYSFLNSVILEVLRMYPSAMFMKETTEDVSVANGKYVIPKGVEIMFYPYFQQRDPKYFERPNEFLPERWSNSDAASEGLSLQAEVAKISRKEAYYPFALGARNCVGRKLALLEMRVFILEMVSAFEMKLPEKMPDGFQEDPFLGVTAYPRHIELKLKPRK